MRFGDYVKNKLYEMAFEQAFALDKIEEQVPGAIIHILCCHLMPHSRDIPHWIDEIAAFTGKMDDYCDVKTKSKRISYANLVSGVHPKLTPEWVKKKISFIERKYKRKFSKEDVNVAIEKTIDIMHDMFLDMANNKFDIENYVEILSTKED